MANPAGTVRPGGEGLSIGHDSGDSVSKDYTPYFRFTGGRIRMVEVSITDDVYVDLERDFHAAVAWEWRRFRFVGKSR